MKKAEYKHGSKYEEVRKLSKTGTYSYYVTIPKQHIEALGWKEYQELKVSLEGKQIVIKKASGFAKKLRCD